MRFKRLLATVLACCIVFSFVPSFVSAGGPTLKEGNHVAWIDRLGDMPQYALDFYDWLADNSQKGGALRTAQGETNFKDGTSGHLVAEIQGTTNSFTFPVGSSDSTIQTNAVNACEANRNAILEEAKNFAFATVGAFDRDYPQVFWLSGNSSIAYSTGYSWSVSRSGGYGEATCVVRIYYILKSSTFDVRASDYTNATIIDQTEEKINSCVNNILSGDFPVNGSRFDKVKYLNNWLTKNNCFNTAADSLPMNSDSRECVAALVGSVGTSGPICESYSRAFKVLCDRLNIPCVLVDGEANTGSSVGGHMWNYVQMENGKWYGIDISWNDPTVAGISSAVSGYENEKYFLVGSKTKISGMDFIVSHPATNTVFSGGFEYTNGPVLSELSYAEDVAAQPQLNLNELKIDAEFVSISNQIDIKFAVIKETFDAANFINPTVEAVFCGQTYLLVPRIETISGIVCYVFTFENLAPQMMGDDVAIALKAGFNGKVYTSEITHHSIATYAYNQLNITTDAKLRTLLVDMLHYGRYAQEFTSYKKNEPVDRNLTEEQSSWGTQSLRDLIDSSEISDFAGEATWLGMGLNLENRVVITGYFDVTSTEGLYVKVINSNSNEVTIITQQEFSSVVGPDAEPVVGFVFDNLSVNQMSDIFEFAVFDSQGEKVSGSFLFSVESYVKKCQNSTNETLLNLINSMMMYGDSARAYAG